MSDARRRDASSVAFGTMSTIRVRGAGTVTLAVRSDGDPEASPLVLLNALCETHQSWAPLLPVLNADHHVLALDLRGHGASDWPGTYSCALMRDDVIAVLDELGIDSVALLGHSLGGAVALLVAEALGDRVSALVLEDAVPPYPREPPPVPEHPSIELPFDWAVLGVAYEEMSDPQMRQWPALAGITAPTLVVAGGPQSHVPADRITEMAALIPDCTVVTIDVGHHIHENAPREFLEAVVPWLATAAR